MSALAELRGVYESRFTQRTEVGYVGADVPRELIEARGTVPVRLAPIAGVDTSFADAVLGPGVDEAVRAILAGLLEGAYPIDRLVLCHDSDHTVRLYTTLRRLRGFDLDLWFLDLLHLPRQTTFDYNRRQLERFSEWLGGDPVSTESRARELAGDVAALRRKGALTGADALAVFGAGTALAAERYTALLAQLVAESTPSGTAPRPVFMHGSDQYDTAVYAAIDELGAAVVGETHSWGERLLTGRISVSNDHQIAWVRSGDESKLWSVPRIPVARELAELEGLFA